METQQITKQLTHSIINYGRMGIIMEILEIDDKEAKVKVVQKHSPNGYFLNQNQLVERVKGVFEHTGLKTKVYPVVYKIDVSVVTPEWITLKMNEFGINRKDIIRQLDLDISSLSLMLNGERKMNKLVRSAFFYYFLTYELNRDLREEIG
ncbi:MAG: hypothetical protein ISP72_02190 [Flavobacteriaceae bacterium]|nr:hypothetical protein [Flavobacteriaceae bacterium]